MIDTHKLASRLMDASIRNLKRVSAKKDPESPLGLYDCVMNRHEKQKLLDNYNIYRELVWLNHEVYGYELHKLTTLLREFGTTLAIAIIVAVILA